MATVGTKADADKLPAECWLLIFQNMTAADVVNALLLSSSYHELAKSGAVWQPLCERQFGLFGSIRPLGGDESKWRTIFATCRTALQSAAKHIYSQNRMEHVFPSPSQLAFGPALANSDSEGEYAAAYPSSLALYVSPNHTYTHFCWCTSRRAHHNASLAAAIVAETPESVLEHIHLNDARGRPKAVAQHALVLAVGVVNAPNDGFSNPAHEILAFGSLHAPTNVTPSGPVGPHLGDERYHAPSTGSSTGGDGGTKGSGGTSCGGGTGGSAEAGRAAADAALVQALLADRGETASLRRAAPGEPLAGLRFPPGSPREAALGHWSVVSCVS